MPREPTSLPKRSRKVTASSDFFSQSSSEVSRNAGIASANITISAPSPSVAPSDSGSATAQRRQPATWKRSMKAEKRSKYSRSQRAVRKTVESRRESKSSKKRLSFPLRSGPLRLRTVYLRPNAPARPVMGWRQGDNRAGGHPPNPPTCQFVQLCSRSGAGREGAMGRSKGSLNVGWRRLCRLSLHHLRWSLHLQLSFQLTPAVFEYLMRRFSRVDCVWGYQRQREPYRPEMQPIKMLWILAAARLTPSIVSTQA